MLIRTGFDIRFETDVQVPMLALLNVRPERQNDLRTPEVLATEPWVPVRQYIDGFGNVCSRFTVPPGGITLKSDFVIEDSGLAERSRQMHRNIPSKSCPTKSCSF
jgi:hypothetical protein